MQHINLHEMKESIAIGFMADQFNTIISYRISLRSLMSCGD